MVGLIGRRITEHPEEAMRPFPRRWCRAACMLALVSVAACSDRPPPDRLVEGQPFPALTLERLGGGKLPVSALRGRLVVLNVHW